MGTGPAVHHARPDVVLAPVTTHDGTPVVDRCILDGRRQPSTRHGQHRWPADEPQLSSLQQPCTHAKLLVRPPPTHPFSPVIFSLAGACTAGKVHGGGGRIS